ncbi:hypothetical protein TRVL_08799 [Trypanosoma vivax]|nr:hypothetical protein TRVL_08799 [Trypanosoma vivax]
MSLRYGSVLRSTRSLRKTVRNKTSSVASSSPTAALPTVGGHATVRAHSTDESEVASLRKQLAEAQLRITELQLSQIAVYESFLQKFAETDREAHKAATQVRYTALSLQCSHDLLETELRRLLAAAPASNEVKAGDLDRVRLAAVEAGAREMVRRNIGFRAEKASAVRPSTATERLCHNSKDETTVV